MKLLFANLRKLTLFSLLCFVFVLSACASGQTAPPTDTNTDNTGSGNGANKPTPTQAAQEPGTGNGQAKVVYAGVEITVVSVDQRNKFADDDYYTDKPWILRVKVKEHNIVDQTSYLNYYEGLRLKLPDGSTIASQKQQTSAFIDQQVLRDNWYDFPLSQKQDANKLVLYIGTATEYQYALPLSQNPDLKKYAAKNITPNSKVKYGGVDWTVTKVTSQYYYRAQQATNGHRYIVIALKADNSSSKAFYSSNDYYRLKTATIMQGPERSTLPFSIDAASRGTTGEIVFLVPEHDTDLTLKFLAQPDNHYTEASTSFKI